MLFQCDVPTVWNINVKDVFTIDPANADRLKDGHKKQTHPAGSVGIKQLEHIHATLTAGGKNTVKYHQIKKRNSQHGLAFLQIRSRFLFWPLHTINLQPLYKKHQGSLTHYVSNFN